MTSSDAGAPRPDRGKDYVVESEAGFDVLFGGSAEQPSEMVLAVNDPEAWTDDVAPALVRTRRRQRRNHQQRR